MNWFSLFSSFTVHYFPFLYHNHNHPNFLGLSFHCTSAKMDNHPVSHPCGFCCSIFNSREEKARHNLTHFVLCILCEEAFSASVRRNLGQGRRRGGARWGDENWRIQLIFLSDASCVSNSESGFKWYRSHFYFLSFGLLVILNSSSRKWNATDEGAFALKALVVK